MNGFFSDLCDEYAADAEYEFFYCRKNWKIRRRFLETFKDKTYDDEINIPLKASDLENFNLFVLKPFLQKEFYNSYPGGALFDWCTTIPHIANAIYQIHLFLELTDYYDLLNEPWFDMNKYDAFMAKHFDIFFYDSY